MGFCPGFRPSPHWETVDVLQPAMALHSTPALRRKVGDLSPNVTIVGDGGVQLAPCLPPSPGEEAATGQSPHDWGVRLRWFGVELVTAHSGVVFILHTTGPRPHALLAKIASALIPLTTYCPGC